MLISGTTATGWPFGGFQSLAAPFLAATGYTSVLDAVISAAVRMRLMGFNPTICVLPEAGFLQTQLARGTDGHYLQAAGLLRDAGLSLALSSSITAGKALLLDPAFVGYLSSGTTRIQIGTTGDQFVRNQRTMRAETELIPFLADFEAAMLVTPSAT